MHQKDKAKLGEDLGLVVKAFLDPVAAKDRKERLSWYKSKVLIVILVCFLDCLCACFLPLSGFVVWPGRGDEGGF